ncbi:hypothetical protein FMM80_17950 [Schaedlerella arabinosiphila]|uniref:Uncharacterized protein n=1 Tax=Schaedlerella arabinosiphila TaxID=2044587 RepID=A0A9X5CA26_9FIRM|nr:hypothetical protein [Schaedlerella arabinosiphila]
MNTILEQFQKKINGTFAFFDRMIIKGYLFPFFSVSGRMYFLSQMNLLLGFSTVSSMKNCSKALW